MESEFYLIQCARPPVSDICFLFKKKKKSKTINKNQVTSFHHIIKIIKKQRIKNPPSPPPHQWVLRFLRTFNIFPFQWCHVGFVAYNVFFFKLCILTKIYAGKSTGWDLEPPFLKTTEVTTGQRHKQIEKHSTDAAPPISEEEVEHGERWNTGGKLSRIQKKKKEIHKNMTQITIYSRTQP